MSNKSRNAATLTRSKLMIFHAFTFEVEGEGRFPMELLGLDFCMPSDPIQYLVAFTLHAGKRRVKLTGFRALDLMLAPSLERWDEANWPVRANTLRTVPQ